MRMNNTEIRKQQILSSAGQLFLEKGYYAVTIDDIAAAVGVVRGTILHYFNSKEALMEAVLDTMGKDFIKEIESILSNQSETIEERQLSMLSACSKQFHLVKPKMAQFSKSDSHFRFLMDQMRIKAFYHLCSLFSSFLDEACEKGVFQIENTTARASSIIFAIFGVTGSNLNEDEMINEYQEVMKRMLY